MAKMLMIVPSGKTDMGQRAESREQRAQSREQIHAELGGGQVKHQQFCTENPCRMGGVNVRPPIPHGFGRFPAVLVKFDSNPGLARFDSNFFNSARIRIRIVGHQFRTDSDSNCWSSFPHGFGFGLPQRCHNQHMVWYSAIAVP